MNNSANVMERPPVTPRELQILRMVANGNTNRDIAARYNITEQTVKNHVSRVFTKLDVTNRTQAALYYRKGILLE